MLTIYFDILPLSLKCDGTMRQRVDDLGLVYFPKYFAKCFRFSVKHRILRHMHGALI